MEAGAGCLTPAPLCMLIRVFPIHTHATCAGLVASLCLAGDCITHIFTSCECVKDAWNNIINNSHGPRDLAWASLFVDRTLPLYIIDYPLADSGFRYNRLALVLTFCWAVHKAIGQIRNGRCAENADSRIVALTLSMNNIWMKSSK